MCEAHLDLLHAEAAAAAEAIVAVLTSCLFHDRRLAFSSMIIVCQGTHTIATEFGAGKIIIEIFTAGRLFWK